MMDEESDEVSTLQRELDTLLEQLPFVSSSDDPIRLLQCLSNVFSVGDLQEVSTSLLRRGLHNQQPSPAKTPTTNGTSKLSGHNQILTQPSSLHIDSTTMGELEAGEILVARMNEEIQGTAGTSTTQAHELGWLATVTNETSQHGVQLMQCSACLRRVLHCRMGIHLRLCSPATAAQPVRQAQPASSSKQANGASMAACKKSKGSRPPASTVSGKGVGPGQAGKLRVGAMLEAGGEPGQVLPPRPSSKPPAHKGTNGVALAQPRQQMLQSCQLPHQQSQLQPQLQPYTDQLQQQSHQSSGAVKYINQQSTSLSDVTWQAPSDTDLLDLLANPREGAPHFYRPHAWSNGIPALLDLGTMHTAAGLSASGLPHGSAAAWHTCQASQGPLPNPPLAQSLQQEQQQQQQQSQQQQNVLHGLYPPHKQSDMQQHGQLPKWQHPQHHSHLSQQHQEQQHDQQPSKSTPKKVQKQHSSHHAQGPLSPPYHQTTPHTSSSHHHHQTHHSQQHQQLSWLYTQPASNIPNHEQPVAQSLVEEYLTGSSPTLSFDSKRARGLNSSTPRRPRGDMQNLLHLLHQERQPSASPSAPVASFLDANSQLSSLPNTVTSLANFSASQLLPPPFNSKLPLPSPSHLSAAHTAPLHIPNMLITTQALQHQSVPMLITARYASPTPTAAAAAAAAAAATPEIIDLLDEDAEVLQRPQKKPKMAALSKLSQTPNLSVLPAKLQPPPTKLKSLAAVSIPVVRTIPVPHTPLSTSPPPVIIPSFPVPVTAWSTVLPHLTQSSPAAAVGSSPFFAGTRSGTTASMLAGSASVFAGSASGTGAFSSSMPVSSTQALTHMLPYSTQLVQLAWPVLNGKQACIQPNLATLFPHPNPLTIPPVYSTLPISSPAVPRPMGAYPHAAIQPNNTITSGMAQKLSASSSIPTRPLQSPLYSVLHHPAPALAAGRQLSFLPLHFPQVSPLPTYLPSTSPKPLYLSQFQPHLSGPGSSLVSPPTVGVPAGMIPRAYMPLAYSHTLAAATAVSSAAASKPMLPKRSAALTFSGGVTPMAAQEVYAAYTAAMVAAATAAASPASSIAGATVPMPTSANPYIGNAYFAASLAAVTNAATAAASGSPLNLPGFCPSALRTYTGEAFYAAATSGASASASASAAAAAAAAGTVAVPGTLLVGSLPGMPMMIPPVAPRPPTPLGDPFSIASTAAAVAVAAAAAAATASKSDASMRQLIQTQLVMQRQDRQLFAPTLGNLSPMGVPARGMSGPAHGVSAATVAALRQIPSPTGSRVGVASVVGGVPVVPGMLAGTSLIASQAFVAPRYV